MSPILVSLQFLDGVEALVAVGLRAAEARVVDGTIVRLVAFITVVFKFQQLVDISFKHGENHWSEIESRDSKVAALSC